MDNTGFVTVNKKKIFYTLLNTNFTDKPFLVFLHDGLGSVGQWGSFPQELSDLVQCPALLYDRYGHGQSEKKSGTLSCSYMHDEAYIYLPDLLNAIGITEKIVLIGHSDGGTISLLYASRYSQNTLGIITEADHVFCESITVKGVKNLVEKFNKRNLKNILKTYHGNKTDSLFSGWSNFWLSESAKNWHILNELSLIASPLMTIQGKKDTFGSVKQLTKKISSTSGDISAHYLSDCGHTPHFDQKEIVQSLMKSFIYSLLKKNI